MIDKGAFGRGAVRKYWLAQDFVRSIATDTIEDVEFVNGDIHRQLITWKSGARVYVNRGKEDWIVAGKRLPEYGYYARSGPVESSIEKINGIIVEQLRGPSGFYVNGRGFDVDFGTVTTEGAFRCHLKENAIIVTPLPETGPFTIALNIDKLAGAKGVKIKNISAVDISGESIRPVKFETKVNRVKFQTHEDEFAYSVSLKR